MQKRCRYREAYAAAYKAMLALSQAVERTGFAPQLIDLVNYRVSQLNGCAVCLDMHAKDLRARGEPEQRLYMISAWREAPYIYSDRDRAALAWAEAVTRLEGQQVPDAVYDMASQQFSEAELTQLTRAIVAINGWNRFNVASHTRLATTCRRRCPRPAENWELMPQGPPCSMGSSPEAKQGDHRQFRAFAGRQS